MLLAEVAGESIHSAEAMSLGDIIQMEMAPHPLFSFNLFGINVNVTDTVVTMWVAMAAIMVLAIVVTRKFKQVPTGRQNVVEMAVEFVNSFTKSSTGHYWRGFAPYFGTVLVFLAVSNAISMFNVIPGEELYKLTGIGFFEHLALKPPAKDINFTAAMAFMSIVLLIASTIRIRGFRGWLHTFREPIAVAMPFKVLDYVTRPLSLCLRLFGNILAAFTVMELLYQALPIVAPAFAGIYFDLFDGILQAYIFVFLTSLYISENIEAHG